MKMVQNRTQEAMKIVNGAGLNWEPIVILGEKGPLTFPTKVGQKDISGLKLGMWGQCFFSFWESPKGI